MSRPGTVPRSRPSRRATVAAPLRVVAERVDPDEASPRPAGTVAGPDAPPAGPRPPRTPQPDPPVPAVAPREGVGEVATVVGLSRTDPDADVELAPVPTVRAPAVREDRAPARAFPDPPRRPGPWARLASLVTGRRRFAGRHRPTEVPVRGWSMFAPSGRPATRRPRVR